jgi:hypothetical protein
MSSKDLGLRISGTIFGIVSILHLLRLLTGASVIIAGYSLPVWVNVLGFFAGGFLCILLLRFSKNEK